MRSEDFDKLYIVIPGLIQKHRKDYDPVISAFERLFNSYKGRIKLFLLGLPVGKFGSSIYKTFEKMRNDGYDVETFDHFVPDDRFDDILTTSDIILAPIKPSEILMFPEVLSNISKLIKLCEQQDSIEIYPSHEEFGVGIELLRDLYNGIANIENIWDNRIKNNFMRSWIIDDGKFKYDISRI